MLETLARWWKRARTRVHRSAGTNHPVTPGGAVDEIDLVDQARREWHAARTLFENVTDPELIDHAIHRMTAAERRYMFLIKEARRAGITEDDLGQVLADPPFAGAAPDQQHPA